MEYKRRVVISGLGLITPRIIGSIDSIEKQRDFQENGSSDAAVRFTYEKINGIDTSSYLPGISLRCVDDLAVYTGVSVKSAIEKYIRNNNIDCSEVGIVLGTAFGSIISSSNFDRIVISQGPDMVNPMEFPNTITNAPASRVGIWFKLKGRNMTISNAFTSSLDAIGLAFEEIYGERAEYYLAGGSEEISEDLYKGYLKTIIEKADKESVNDCVEVIAEGSGMVFLSSLEKAAENKYDIYGEITDYFSTTVFMDDNYADNIVDSIITLISNNKADTEGVVLYTSFIPFNGITYGLYKKIEDRFGDGSLVIGNKYGRKYINYLGFNGAVNLSSALTDMKNNKYGNKAAVVFDIDCSGRFSALVVKKADCLEGFTCSKK